VSKQNCKNREICGYLWRFYLQVIQAEQFGELSKDITWFTAQLYLTEINTGEAGGETHSLELTMSPGFPAGPIGPGAPSDP